MPLDNLRMCRRGGGELRGEWALYYRESGHARAKCGFCFCAGVRFMANRRAGGPDCCQLCGECAEQRSDATLRAHLNLKSSSVRAAHAHGIETQTADGSGHAPAA